MAIRKNVLRKQRYQREREERLPGDVEHIIRGWQLWDDYRRDFSAGERAALPQKFWDGGLALPLVLPPRDAAAVPQAQEVVRQSEAALGRIPEGIGPELSPGRWWRLYPTTLHTLLASYQRAGGDPPEALREADDELLGRIEEAFTEVYREALLRRSRLDAGFCGLALRIGPGPGGGRRRVLAELDFTPPEEIQAGGSGGSRPAYRSGLPRVRPWHRRAGPWYDWPAEVLPGGGGPYRVYVQSHVFHKLAERVDVPVLADYLHFALGESLERPVVIPRPGGGFLVEYRMCGVKLGYLVADAYPGYVVVRTFLFLTMGGTPEGGRVAGRLRLLRRDLSYLRLDRWSPFLASDLGQDRGLVDLFTGCGCGSLFQDPREWDVVPKLTGFARELRHHMGMPE